MWLLRFWLPFVFLCSLLCVYTLYSVYTHKSITNLCPEHPPALPQNWHLSSLPTMRQNCPKLISGQS